MARRSQETSFRGGTVRRLRSHQMLRGSVKNLQQFSTNRAFTAIVGPSRSADVDFIDVQKAVDHVSKLGGGTVFIKSGSYKPTSPIKMKTNVSLLGEDPETTIVDLTSVGDATNGGVQITGSDLDNSGTIAVTNGSSTVTGTSTNFADEDIVAGDFISIRANVFEIESITNDTSLELTEDYQGAAESGLTYRVYRMKTNISISNLLIRNGRRTTTAGAGIFMDSCYLVDITNNTIENCTHGIEVADTFNSSILSNLCRTNSSDGINILRAGSTHIVGNNCINNERNGIRSGSAAHGVAIYITDNVCSSNDDYGIHLFVANSHILKGNTCASNAIHGIFLEGSKYNTLTGNAANFNTTDGLHVTARIAVDSEFNTISNNVFFTNGDDGIELTATGNNNAVTANITQSNGGTDLVNNGSGNQVANNV